MEKQIEREQIVEVALEIRQIAMHSEFDTLYEVLDKITIPQGCKLVVKNSKEHYYWGYRIGILFPTKEILWDTYKSAFWDYLRVERCIMGAWQAFLLERFCYNPPLSMESKYINSRKEQFFNDRDYILLPRQLEHIKELELRTKWQKVILNPTKYDIRPNIVQSGDNFHVTAYYWSVGRGLVSESQIITINNKGNVTMHKPQLKCVHKYDCGVYV